jgi:hypothetical protein
MINSDRLKFGIIMGNNQKMSRNSSQSLKLFDIDAEKGRRIFVVLGLAQREAQGKGSKWQ